jgi:hypothetical protein
MSFARHRRTSYLALAAAVALALSACSSSTPATKATGSSSAGATGSSAAALLDQLRKSSTAAKSVRIKGDISNGSTTSSKAVKVQVDIAGDRAGKNSRALINDGTGSIEILTAGGATYIKADKAYWTKNGSPAVAKTAAGKYLKVPAGSAAGMGDLTVGKLLDQIFANEISISGKVLTKVEKGDVDGIPAYVLTDRVGGDNSKIYVSADGQARLLRIVGPKSQPTTLNFTEWDAVKPVSAPPADQLGHMPGL